MKLEKDIKEKWIEALRSSNYTQTESILYDGTIKDKKPHMCCLGVLEHILGTPLDFMWDGDDVERYCVPSNLCEPKSIFGKNVNHDKEIENVENQLINMNDGNTAKKIKKHSFEEIADYIEENL